MTDLLGARRLRELLDRHGVRPTRALGQNFVIDPNTIRKVVQLAALRPDDEVLEMGAGAGSLTVGLAQGARRVVAVEFDAALIPILREVVGGLGNVEVVRADAMRMDLPSLGPLRVMGNLPYNIAAPLVLRVLRQAPAIPDILVMTQKEVGERLAAAPGSTAYGRASVMVAFFGSARVVARVSRRAFYPVPGVDSVVVRVERRRPPEGVESDVFASVVGAAFAQRRKMLRSTLVPVAGSPGAAAELLRRAGIPPTRRAEEVDLEGFASLASLLGTGRRSE